MDDELDPSCFLPIGADDGDTDIPEVGNEYYYEDYDDEEE